MGGLSKVIALAGLVLQSAPDVYLQSPFHR